MKRLVLSLAGMALLAAMQESSAADLKVGDDAPAFELKGSDGKTHKLADFKGKQAVLWPGTPSHLPVAEQSNAFRSVRTAKPFVNTT